MLIVRLFAYILLIASASSAELKLSTFLEAHCYDCHDEEKQKGGLDLKAAARADLGRFTAMDRRGPMAMEAVSSLTAANFVAESRADG